MMAFHLTPSERQALIDGTIPPSVRQRLIEGVRPYQEYMSYEEQAEATVDAVLEMDGIDADSIDYDLIVKRFADRDTSDEYDLIRSMIHEPELWPPRP